VWKPKSLTATGNTMYWVVLICKCPDVAPPGKQAACVDVIHLHNTLPIARSSVRVVQEINAGVTTYPVSNITQRYSRFPLVLALELLKKPFVSLYDHKELHTCRDRISAESLCFSCFFSVYPSECWISRPILKWIITVSFEILICSQFTVFRCYVISAAEMRR
jgi:hypothetical protein